MEPDYASRIAGIGRELGIPADYAIRRRLPLQPEMNEAELVSINAGARDREIRLAPPAAKMRTAMHAAAIAE